MGFGPPIAVFDACVLYPFHLKNIVAQARANGQVARGVPAQGM